MQSCWPGVFIAGMEPECRAHRKLEWCGQHSLSIESAPGLHGVVVIVRGDLTAEPPAHCRLVSGHDLRQDGGRAEIIPLNVMERALRKTEGGKLSFPVVRHERHSPRSRHAIACARPAAPVKAGRRPPAQQV